MTVENQVNKTEPQVMGTNFDYAFTFTVLTKDPTEEIAKQSIKVTVSDGITQTQLTYGTDYSVTLNANGIGGTVTVTDKRTSDYSLIVYREYDFKQESDYQNYNAFPADTLERNLDKLTMITQQLAEQVGRSVTVDIFSNTDPSSLVSEIEALYDVKDEVITAAENIGSIVITAQNINEIKDAPNQANSARNSAIAAQNSAVTAQLMAAQAGESVSAAAASASAADASAAASASSAQTAHDYALQAVRNNIGDFFYTSRLDAALNGAVEANGAQYNVADFTGPQAVPALLAAGKLPYIGIAIFDALVAANGSCRAWGWDGADATVFKVPKLNDVYLMAGIAAAAGEFISESLPNIKGSFTADPYPLPHKETGCFSRELLEGTYRSTGTDTANISGLVKFDASESAPAYQDGARVRPDSVRYRAFVQIATGAIDEALETCTGVLADVADLKQNKADVDASNFSSIGKSVLSGLGMPSKRYIDLTLGASEATYTAPANGWFNLITQGLTYLDMYRTNDRFGSISNPNNGYARKFVPIQKGQSLAIYYSGTPTNTSFRFYYAEGDE